VPVRARIESMDSMSAHADSNEIMRWLGNFTRPPALTCLVHGEPGPMDVLKGPHRTRVEVERAHAATPGDDRTLMPRKYLLEQIDDAAVVQLYADGFAQLPLDQKTLAWHLYQAALAGRDIYYDQRYRHALEMREILEEILTHADGIPERRCTEIRRYTKLFWINSGPHNNMTSRKFVLACSPDALP
jgi:hypothetical protein